jgi:hypothetical protein
MDVCNHLPTQQILNTKKLKQYIKTPNQYNNVLKRLRYIEQNYAMEMVTLIGLNDRLTYQITQLPDPRRLNKNNGELKLNMDKYECLRKQMLIYEQKIQISDMKYKNVKEAIEYVLEIGKMLKIDLQ